MDDSRSPDPGSGHPPARPTVPPPVVRPAPGDPGGGAELGPDADGGDPGGGGSSWRRLTRSRRGAAGLGIGAATLLLWPFAGWSPWPWLAGLGLLVLLRLLRLDGLLRGWAWHLAGLTVVGGLMLSTGAWEWATAAAIGLLIAGLLQLPQWRIAAAGAAACVVAGSGLAITSFQTAEQVAQQQVQTSLQNRGQLGAPRPTAVLPVLLNSLARGDAGAVCDNLLAEQARPGFAASVGAPDCRAAVAEVAARVTDRTGYASAEAPSTRRGDTFDVDACAMIWRRTAAAGPQLGELTIGRIGQTYVVTGFRPC